MRRGVDGAKTYVSFETISTESPCTCCDSYTTEINDVLGHGLGPEKGSEKPLLKNPESFPGDHDFEMIANKNIKSQTRTCLLPGDHDIEMIVNKIIKSHTRNVSFLQSATAHTLQSWRSVKAFMELEEVSSRPTPRRTAGLLLTG
jgi:hypothetical protein